MPRCNHGSVISSHNLASAEMFTVRCRPRTWRLTKAKPDDNDDTSHLAALHDNEPVAVKLKGRKTKLVLDDVEKLISALHAPLSPVWALCKALFGLSILFYGLEVIVTFNEYNVCSDFQCSWIAPA
jgi:hypothetical protein